MPPKKKTSSTQRNGATAPPKGNPSFGKSRSSRRRANKRAKNPSPTYPNPSMPFQRVPATSVFGDRSSYQSTSGEIPSAFVNIDSNSTFCSSLGPVVHPYTGVEGVAFVGCQPLSTITMNNTASDSSVWTSGTLASLAADNNAINGLILLSPDELNGRLAALANLYSQFVFRDIVIEYVSNCATTQPNSFALCYDRDAFYSAAALLTFSNVRSTQPSITIPFRTDRAYFHYHYPGQEIFYQKTDTATSSGLRLTHQGALVAYADKAQGNVASLGYTNIWYVVELYNPVSTQAITLLSLTPDEKRLVQRYRERGELWELPDHCDVDDQKEGSVRLVRSPGIPDLTRNSLRRV